MFILTVVMFVATILSAYGGHVPGYWISFVSLSYFIKVIISWQVGKASVNSVTSTVQCSATFTHVK